MRVGSQLDVVALFAEDAAVGEGRIDEALGGEGVGQGTAVSGLVIGF